jgi:hypothetical protein
MKNFKNKNKLFFKYPPTEVISNDSKLNCKSICVCGGVLIVGCENGVINFFDLQSFSKLHELKLFEFHSIVNFKEYESFFNKDEINLWQVLNIIITEISVEKYYTIIAQIRNGLIYVIQFINSSEENVDLGKKTEIISELSILSIIYVETCGFTKVIYDYTSRFLIVPKESSLDFFNINSKENAEKFYDKSLNIKCENSCQSFKLDEVLEKDEVEVSLTKLSNVTALQSIEVDIGMNNLVIGFEASELLLLKINQENERDYSNFSTNKISVPISSKKSKFSKIIEKQTTSIDEPFELSTKNDKLSISYKLIKLDFIKSTNKTNNITCLSALNKHELNKLNNTEKSNSIIKSIISVGYYDDSLKIYFININTDEENYKFIHYLTLENITSKIKPGISCSTFYSEVTQNTIYLMIGTFDFRLKKISIKLNDSKDSNYKADLINNEVEIAVFDKTIINSIFIEKTRDSTLLFIAKDSDKISVYCIN